MKRVKKVLIYSLSLLLIISTVVSGLIPIYAVNEYAIMREKFHDMAVGGNYDVNNLNVKPMLQSINDTAQLYWDNMNKNPISNAVKGNYMNSDDTALILI